MPRPVSLFPLSPSLLLPLSFTFALLLTPAAHALSVIAPTFPQLVAAADTIARGTVTATSCVVPVPAAIDAAVATAYLETRYQ